MIDQQMDNMSSNRDSESLIENTEQAMLKGFAMVNTLIQPTTYEIHETFKMKSSRRYGNFYEQMRVAYPWRYISTDIKPTMLSMQKISASSDEFNLNLDSAFNRYAQLISDFGGFYIQKKFAATSLDMLHGVSKKPAWFRRTRFYKYNTKFKSAYATHAMKYNFYNMSEQHQQNNERGSKYIGIDYVNGYRMQQLYYKPRLRLRNTDDIANVILD